MPSVPAGLAPPKQRAESQLLCATGCRSGTFELRHHDSCSPLHLTLHPTTLVLSPPRSPPFTLTTANYTQALTPFLQKTPGQGVRNKEPLLQAAGAGGGERGEDSWGLPGTGSPAWKAPAWGELGRCLPGFSTPSAAATESGRAPGGEETVSGARPRKGTQVRLQRADGGRRPGLPAASDSPAPAPRAPRRGPTHLDQAATLLPQGALRGLASGGLRGLEPAATRRLHCSILGPSSTLRTAVHFLF